MDIFPVSRKMGRGMEKTRRVCLQNPGRKLGGGVSFYPSTQRPTEFKNTSRLSRVRALKAQLRTERYTHVVTDAAVEIHFVSALQSKAKMPQEALNADSGVQREAGVPIGHAS